MEKDGGKFDPDVQFQKTKFVTNSQPPPYPHQHLLGPDNTMTTCQFCDATVTTAVKYTSTTRTHFVAAFCGLLCCCCCFPYYIKSTKNTDHYCPYCDRYLGTYER